MAGFGRRYFLVANAKQHYLPLRRTQRLNQIRRLRRSRYADRRTSGLPLRTDFRRYFARQYTHRSVFRPDYPRRRLHVDRMDVTDQRPSETTLKKNETRTIAHEKNALEFWVGLFVLLGAAAIGFPPSEPPAGNRSANPLKPTPSMPISATSAAKTNAPVKSAGVLVGRVASIQLDPKSYQAKVALNLDSQYQFSSDVSAQILTSGLLGEQYIGLQQGGDTDSLAAGDTITVTSSAMVLKTLSANSRPALPKKTQTVNLPVKTNNKHISTQYSGHSHEKTSFISALSIGVSISMAFASPADAVNQVRENSVQVLKILNSGDANTARQKATPSLTSTSNA